MKRPRLFVGIVVVAVAVGAATCAVVRTDSAPPGTAVTPRPVVTRSAPRERVRVAVADPTAENSGSEAAASEAQAAPASQPDARKPGDVTVTVRDEDGAVVSGTHVVVQRLFGSHAMEVVFDGQTDAEGVVTFRPPDRARHVLFQATHGTTGSDSRDVQLDLDSPAHVSLTLHATAALVGVVVRPDRTTVAGMRVSLEFAGPIPGLGTSQVVSVQTDDAGHFAFPARPLTDVRRARLRLSGDAGPGTEVDLSTVIAGTNELRVELPAALPLRLRALDAHAQPQRVAVWGLAADGARIGALWTDRDGRLESAEFPADTRAIWLVSPGDVRVVRALSPTSDHALLDLGDIVVAAVGRVAGRVTIPDELADRPIVAVLSDKATGIEVAAARCRGDRFAFDSVGPGELTVGFHIGEVRSDGATGCTLATARAGDEDLVVALPQPTLLVVRGGGAARRSLRVLLREPATRRLIATVRPPLDESGTVPVLAQGQVDVSFGRPMQPEHKLGSVSPVPGTTTVVAIPAQDE